METIEAIDHFYSIVTHIRVIFQKKEKEKSVETWFHPSDDDGMKDNLNANLQSIVRK